MRADPLRAKAERVLVRTLVDDTSWHGLNDPADWSKGYWTHPGRVAEIVGAEVARLTAALAECNQRLFELEEERDRLQEDVLPFDNGGAGT